MLRLRNACSTQKCFKKPLYPQFLIYCKETAVLQWWDLASLPQTNSDFLILNPSNWKRKGNILRKSQTLLHIQKGKLRRCVKPLLRIPSATYFPSHLFRISADRGIGVYGLSADLLRNSAASGGDPEDIDTTSVMYGVLLCSIKREFLGLLLDS